MSRPCRVPGGLGKVSTGRCAGAAKGAAECWLWTCSGPAVFPSRHPETAAAHLPSLSSLISLICKHPVSQSVASAGRWEQVKTIQVFFFYYLLFFFLALASPPSRGLRTGCHPIWARSWCVLRFGCFAAVWFLGVGSRSWPVALWGGRGGSGCAGVGRQGGGSLLPRLASRSHPLRSAVPNCSSL